MTAQPSPGDGYRWLTEGEIVQEGDEWWQGSKGAWVPITITAGRKAQKFSRRRKIGVETVVMASVVEYRMLTKEDIIRADDEMASYTQTFNISGWARIDSYPNAKWCIGRKWSNDLVEMRRKVTPTWECSGSMQCRKRVNDSGHACYWCGSKEA